MIASKDSFEPHSSEQLPNSKRVYISGEQFPELRVPMREIELHDTKKMDGSMESNAPVRVYDCSGPWGDPDFKGDVKEGLPAMRRKWLEDREDLEEYDGREITPEDNGYL
ncbi:MAG: phosphomethylpyrimidine synthase, partial [Limisphaerales bacterium]